MSSYGNLVQAAKELERRLGNRAFTIIPRLEVTELLRDTRANTRLKRTMAAELERALLEQGVRVYPRLQDTTTGDNVRLFRPRTVIASLVDMIMHPSDETDKEIAIVTTKVKGLWNWDQ